MRRTAVRLAISLSVIGAGALALPASSATTPPPLPDMASIGSVVGAPAAWAAGASGQGVDVALIDTGVTPVNGLVGSNKLLYGPDLSFDSQNADKMYVDGYGHGTAIAGIIAGNDETAGGYQGVAPNARI